MSPFLCQQDLSWWWNEAESPGFNRWMLFFSFWVGKSYATGSFSGSYSDVVEEILFHRGFKIGLWSQELPLLVESTESFESLFFFFFFSFSFCWALFCMPQFTISQGWSCSSQLTSIRLFYKFRAMIGRNYNTCYLFFLFKVVSYQFGISKLSFRLKDTRKCINFQFRGGIFVDCETKRRIFDIKFTVIAFCFMSKSFMMPSYIWFSSVLLLSWLLRSMISFS